ncbi:MAG: GatB/YqeY domain-containing protein [Alphaproteobacteria bacterium]|nr:GatB/YqeY domain-containing protein [Alphaproteobacteria bacterium]
MREQFNEALKASVKEQNKLRTSTLRLIIAAVKDRDISARSADNAEGVGDDEILDILSRMVKQRQESATTYEVAGRAELAAQERAEIEVIEEYLPRRLNDEETQAAIEDAMTESGAQSLKDMGRLMGLLKSKYAGQMDFGKAGEIAKKRLG